MKTYMLMAILWLTVSSCYAQILFEPGYFIDNTGKRTECLIRNTDWKNNPERFKYKVSENSEVQTAGIEMVQEFSIPGKVKFSRHTVDIDRRSYLAKDLSVVRDPIFQNERLFLKTLVEGEADLLSYEDGNLVRFFYRTGDQQPQQLVYTRYKTQGDKTTQNFNNYRTQSQRILENLYYKSQLSQELKCDRITSTEIDGIAYKKDDLISYFSRYNNCLGQEYSVLGDGNEGQFHLRIRPGINLNSFKVGYYLPNVPENDFGQHIEFRIGAELEMVLPFNSNKWAITLEPFFRTFKTENDNDTYAEYSSMVATFGIRHYLFLGEESKIFFNGNFGFDFPLASDFRIISSGNVRRNFEVPNKVLANYLALGTGFNWNDQLSVELRYMFAQDLLMQYEFWTANYSGASLILGINLF